MVQIADEHPDALPPGTTMGEFKIEQVLGVGGFGIVYRALDQLLERRVALKEYLPSALAGRTADGAVSVRMAQHAETFGVGLNSFINEARLLARFDHPALVKVHRFWQGQGTAYMVMPLYEGRTLRDVRRGLAQSPDEAWLRALTAPLLGALEVLHADQVYHRDIAPDNIILREGAGPVLLDFGAARRVISDRTQTLTAILKPNFAPIEQYADSSQLRQGPWTDVYALAAVVYFCLAGRPPMPAASRALHDELPSFAEVAEGIAAQGGPTFRPGFLAAWQAALSVRPSDRPQSVAALRALLDASAAEPLPAAVAPSAAGPGADGPTLALGADPAMAPTLRVTRPATAFEPTMPVTLPPASGGVSPSSRPVFDPSLPPTLPAPAVRPSEPSGDATRFEPTFTRPPSGAAAVPASAAAAPADPLMAPLMPSAPRPMPPETATVTPRASSAPATAGAGPARGPWLVAAAVVLVLAGAGTAWFLKPAPPAVEAVAEPASAPASATPAAPVAPVEVAASAVVPVVVPGSSLPPEAASTPGVAPLSAARSLGLTESKPAPPRDAARAKPAPKAAAGVAEGAASGSAAPGASTGPASAPAAVPVAPAAASLPERLPATATEACGKRVFVALWRCMEVQCKRPLYAGQADCASYVKERTPGRRE